MTCATSRTGEQGERMKGCSLDEFNHLETLAERLAPTETGVFAQERAVAREMRLLLPAKIAMEARSRLAK